MFPAVLIIYKAIAFPQAGHSGISFFLLFPEICSAKKKTEDDMLKISQDFPVSGSPEAKHPASVGRCAFEPAGWPGRIERVPQRG